ncbi:type I-B CRISPR-associated protein Cas5b [Methanocaldococcus infernus]|uniref:CRISPR-associated protein Cas5, Hmari subtype n=1 Tax=Methanocaldococcus infernus (strain DSM 11812 / JCM 15783 / ME) TaxID=573063 RepID=D5VTE5_METIM|nr:type I-B CRISPR-associated protein Cas5b [Methanocaldococcus infernus]ADG13848.1 CRISPR-associated protein Cas5, Hmari subtype [Methanocaldococcus infernus ME]
MNVLVFDIWADYGHFKKIYTTTSPLTYDIIPKTTIYGILGAILGLKKNEYLKYINGSTSYIGLRILNPIKKCYFGINLINTKDNYFIPVKKTGHEPRTQIRFEMLKNPKYRIYVSLKDDKLHEKLKNLLEEHKTVYTLYMGISELIANFKYIGEFEAIKNLNSNNFVEINSVIRKDHIKDILFEENKEYLFSKFPNDMNLERVTTEYVDIFYEKNGYPIRCKVNEFFKLKELNENITFI